jgi:hypothetical protein
VNYRLVTILLIASVPLSNCDQSEESFEESEGESSVPDSGGMDATGAVDTGGNDASIAYLGENDSRIPEGVPDGSVTREGNPLEDVEMCLESMRASWALVEWASLTDSEGGYAIDTTNYIPDSSYSLTPRKPGYAFDPPSITLGSIGPFVAGNVEDDFVVTKIETGPQATGQWQLVEYSNSTSDPCDALVKAVPIVPAGMYSAFYDNCEKEIGAIYTFKDGCMFEEPSINCVDGRRYTEGSGHCRTDPASAWSEYIGRFDEDTERWHLTESAWIVIPAQGTGGPGGGTAELYTAELVLERVSSAVPTP